MRNRYNFVLIGLMAMLVLLPFSCKKEEAEPNSDPVEEIIIADETRVMPLESRASIQSIDTTDFTFTMTKGDSFIDNLKVGDILVDSMSSKASYGYLRKITKVEESKDGTFQIETEQAQLHDAIHQGEIDFHTASMKKSKIRNLHLSDGVVFDQNKNPDFTIFDFDYEMIFEDKSAPESGKVTVSGHTGLSLDFFFQFKWGVTRHVTDSGLVYYILGVKKFKTGIELDQDANINFVSENGFDFEDQKSLASFGFDPWVFTVGPVPVVFYPEIELFIDVKGEVSAVFSAGASETYHGMLGVQYIDGWSVLKESTFTADYYLPQLTIGCQNETHIGPEVSLLLYGVAGPFTNLTGCYSLNADLNTGTQNWNLDFIVGANSEVGVEIDILGFEENWSTELCLLRDTLYHLGNEPFSDGISLIYPVDGGSYNIGTPLTIEVSVTGQSPDEVQFFVDGENIGSDNASPYTLEWNTSDASNGSHTILVKEIVGGSVEATDEAVIYMQNADWTAINLAEFVDDQYNIFGKPFILNGGNGPNSDIIWLDYSMIGMSGGILKSNNGGQDWEEVYANFGSPPSKLHFIENNMGYAIRGGASGGNWLMKTIDGGSTWSDWEIGDYPNCDDSLICGQNVRDFSFVPNPDADLVVLTSSYIQRINTAITDCNPFDLLVSVYALPYEPHYTIGMTFNGTTGLVYGLQGETNLTQRYLVSDDAGVSWEGKVFNIPGFTENDHIEEAFFLNESKGWLVGGQSGADGAFVMITNDGGNTWELISMDEVNSFTAVHFISPNIGYATVGDETFDPAPKLYKTTDGGYSWEAVQEVTTTSGMYQIHFNGTTNAVVCGGGQDIYHFTIN